MPEQKPTLEDTLKERAKPNTMIDLARGVLGNLGMLGPVKTEKTIDVIRAKPPLQHPITEEWWKAPHRGKMIEILLGDVNKPPTGVHMNEDLLKEINRVRSAEDKIRNIGDNPDVAEAWRQIEQEHPHIAKFVRYVSADPKLPATIGGQMNWSALRGGPDIIINPNYKGVAGNKSTFAHELGHVGQQLNWNTYEQAEDAYFPRNQNYLDRLGEQQSYDLTEEYDLVNGRRSLPERVYPTDPSAPMLDTGSSYLESLFKKLLPAMRNKPLAPLPTKK